MRRFNSVGVLNKVFPNKVVIEVPNISKVNHNYKGDLYIFKGINEFVTIYKSRSNKFIYQVIGLYEQEKPITKEETSKFSDISYFEAIPVGEIENHEFKYGLSHFPMIGDEAYLTLRDDLNTILKLTSDDSFSFSLGSMTSDENYYPKLSIDLLLSNHMSILGNTGSGKSTTIRKLLNEVMHKSNSIFDINSTNFLIFDVHDEYDSIPQEYSSIVDVSEDISMPLGTLTIDDWINLVQPSPGIQLPVLLNGLRLGNLIENDDTVGNWIKVYCALVMYENVHTDVVGKRTKIVSLLSDVHSSPIKAALENYSSQYGNFRSGEEEQFKTALKNYIKEHSGYAYEQCRDRIEALMEESECSVDNLATLQTGINLVFLFEEMKGNSQVRSYCSTLMTRIDNLVVTYSKSLFDNSEKKLSRFEEVMSFDKGFTIFKVSSLDDSDLLFFTGYILRCIYNEQKETRKTEGINKLFHFVFDEAHKYILEGSEKDLLYSIKVFEAIAKEGRKFGVFMILISQRPGELSKTVISQCNNFILHRIRNNIDLEQMKKSIPYLTESQLTRLSFLRTGTALLVGEAFSIPMELLIDGEKYGESSKTAIPSKIWKKRVKYSEFKEINEQEIPSKKIIEIITENENHIVEEILNFDLDKIGISLQDSDGEVETYEITEVLVVDVEEWDITDFEYFKETNEWKATLSNTAGIEVFTKVTENDYENGYYDREDKKWYNLPTKKREGSTYLIVPIEFTITINEDSEQEDYPHIYLSDLNENEPIEIFIQDDFWVL